jgi:hypothetical protein
VYHVGDEERVRRLQGSLLGAVKPLADVLRRAMRTGEVRRVDPLGLAIMFFGLVHEYFLHAPSVWGPHGLKVTRPHTDLVVSVFFDGVGRAQAVSGV